MSDGTTIEWTQRPGTKGASWNPVRARSRATGKVGWHCTHASEGCRNCYAEGINKRLGTGLAYKPGHEKDLDIFVDDAALMKPLTWRAPRTIFCGSMTDLFADFVTDAMLDRIFAVAALCPQHVFIMLTKRPERMRGYLSAARAHPVALEALEITLLAHLADERSEVGKGCIVQGDICHLKVWPLPNVWLGVSCEDQQTADARVPALLATPAAVRFVSAEPLLGPVDFGRWIPTCYECGASCGLRLATIPKVERCAECGEECGPDTEPVISEGCPKCGGELEAVCPDCGHYMVYQHPDTPCLDQIIVGGESGPRARPMHPAWVRSIRDQCAAAGTAFFFKQWGEWAPGECSSHAPTRTERVASLFNEEWRFDTVTPRASEEMHRDDEPDVWRFGKPRAGRLLDGRAHDDFPEVTR